MAAFACTAAYVVMAVGRLPRLRSDRTGAAVIMACLEVGLPATLLTTGFGVWWLS